MLSIMTRLFRASPSPADEAYERARKMNEELEARQQARETEREQVAAFMKEGQDYARRQARLRNAARLFGPPPLRENPTAEAEHLELVRLRLAVRRESIETHQLEEKARAE